MSGKTNPSDFKILTLLFLSVVIETKETIRISSGLKPSEILIGER